MVFLNFYQSVIPGNDVPNATKAIAVIVSVRPTVQPNYKIIIIGMQEKSATFNYLHVLLNHQ
jgi:hypothetical protein